jgi:hypothetical protein
MVWAKRVIMTLTLLLLACPALAAIDRFTDDKGVLHITNSNTEKPRLEERDQDSSPAPRLLPRTPDVAQPSQETDQPEPEDKEETTKPSSYLTVRKGVIHITNVTGRQVDLAQSEPAASQPVAEVSQSSGAQVEPPAAPVMPAAFAKVARWPAERSPAPQRAGASVNTYKDRQGVIHITNAPPRHLDQDIMLAGWSSPPARSEAAAGGAAPGLQASEERVAESKVAKTFLARKSETEATLPLTRVSFTESEPLGAFPVTTTSGSDPPLGAQASATVRRFRDAKGVLHIVGRGPPLGDRLLAPLVPAGGLIARASLLATAAGIQDHQGRGRPGALRPSVHEPTVLVRKDKQGRLLIRNAPAGQTPASDKEDVRRRLGPVLVEAAHLFGLPVSLIEAVIKVESDFQTAAVSPKGATGLMQLMPGTARFLGVEDPFCPRENILGGCRYLRLLLDFFGQSLPLALAAYNAGFQRVIDSSCQVPDIKETQDFVTKVMGNYYLREKLRYYNQRLIL